MTRGLTATGSGYAASNAIGDGATIALLLPETATTRYEEHDRPKFEAKVEELLAAGDRLGWPWETVTGLGLLGVGAAWLALGRRRLLQPRRTAEALGAVAVVSGPEVLVVAGSEAWLWVGLAVALGLLVAGSTLGRPVLLGVGAATLVLFLSEVAATWWRSLGAPLALLLAGLGLVGAAVVVARLRPGGGAATPPRPQGPLSR